jgi:hypothetical protein
MALSVRPITCWTCFRLSPVASRRPWFKPSAERVGRLAFHPEPGKLLER